jgi:hypothetical protein
LTLYVRQMAWLQAVPKPPEGSKRAKAVQQAQISRIDRMTKDGITAAMPSNPMPHVITRLIEIGITESTGMGPAPLSWSEIGAWQASTGVLLAPWEAKLLRQLSIAYLSETRRAESENCPPPWRAEVSDRERDIEDARLRMVLG